MERDGMCVCVPLVVTGIQSDCANFFVFQQGVAADHLGPLPPAEKRKN